MTTLTITEAKKNLTRWLKAAAQGEEIGIITGADIIALRKVEIQAADYAWREPSATATALARLEKPRDAHHQQIKQSGSSTPAVAARSKTKRTA